MAEFLYRLGGAAARRAWVVIGGWAALLGLAGCAYAAGHGALAASFDIPGLPSSSVVDELAVELPQYAGASGTIVLQTTDGQPFTQDQRDRVAAAVASAAALPDLAQAVDPFAVEAERRLQAEELAAGQEAVAAGRQELDQAEAQLDATEQTLAADPAPATLDPEAITAARAQLAEQRAVLEQSRIELEAQAAQLTAAQEMAELAAPIRVVSEDGAAALVQLAFTEPRLDLASASKHAAIKHFEDAGGAGVEVAASVELSQDVPDVLGPGEAIGLALAALVLVVMFRALIPTATPVIGAVVGVGVATLATLALSSTVTMTSVTPILGVMLGLAVGVDYSLFIVNRHRRQVADGMAPLESVALANGTSGTAVVFAGTTVVVALAALAVTNVPFLGLMGVIGAAAVAVAILVAITETPAMLGLAGRRVLPRGARSETHQADREAPKQISVRGGIVGAVLATAVLATLAVPALDLRLGLPDGSSERAGSLAERAHAATAERFGPGANGPLLVTAHLPEQLDDAARLAAQIDVATALGSQEGVAGVAPVAVSASGAQAVFQVLPVGGPNDRSTEDLVKRLRELDADPSGQALGVAGQAAINIDISDRLRSVLPLYLGVVVGLTLLILILVFRSLLVPAIATGGFILSLVATLGAVVAVFQWGWAKDAIGLAATGPVLNFLPVIIAGVLFGLAMDYQIFLAAGMREAHVHGASPRQAVARGLKAGRPVVIAAGLIMVAIFGSFAFAESAIIKSLGFALAVGVLADAFVVRLVLMPALMTLIGRSAWWIPRWLDRILPQADIEGARLERRHAVPTDAADTADTADVADAADTGAV